MIDIYATTFNGHLYEKHYLNDDFGKTIAKFMGRCDDCKYVMVCDGFTGEILDEIRKE